ncbi:MAG: SPOR domain-containing protein [bacterium]
MTRDFKNRPHTGSALNDPVTWLLLGLAIGLIIGLTYLLKKPTEVAATPNNNTSTSQTSTASNTPAESSTNNTSDNPTSLPAADQATQDKLNDTIAQHIDRSTEDDQPSFLFYAMLPKVEVDVPVTLAPEPKPDPKPKPKPEPKPAEPAKEPDPKPVAEAAPKPQKGNYILQVGAFKTVDESEQMRGKMQALGLNAYIEKATVNGISWHRVRVGPLSTLDDAKNLRSRLASNGVKSYLKKVN